MRFKITCRCRVCGNRWSRITSDADSPDPPCPRITRWDEDGKPIERCGTAVRPIGMDLSLSTAPGIIGGSVQVKAIDETAKIVMEDYGYTDLRDDVRQTETMTPKLPPQQQAMADNYFGGGGRKRDFGGLNLARHARAAMAGALVDPGSTNRSIGSVHANRIRPPTHIVADDRTARR